MIYSIKMMNSFLIVNKFCIFVCNYIFNLMIKNKKMRIRKKFLQLTKYTYPHGTEDFLKSYLPKGIKTDNYGNYYYLIGDRPTTMFTCHLDTACSKQVKVNHVHIQNIIKTDGSSILGADDKAGMVIILNMIENKVPGLYYFFIGEEVGCVGSKKLSQDWISNEFSYTISKVISFDRKSDCSVITHQWYGRCCSDKFAEELSFRLNSTEQGLKLRPDDTGVLTDSAQFMNIVPECTNISVGYMYEHTNREYQDIDYLQRLCKAVCLIDWETLPVERNLYHVEDEEDFFETDEEGYSEEFYSYFKIDDNKSKKMYIAIDLIKQENELIKNYLMQNGYSDMYDITWNGHKCYAQNETGNYDFVGSRVDLMEMISDLSSVPLNKIKEKLNKKQKDISHLVF